MDFWKEFVDPQTLVHIWSVDESSAAPIAAGSDLWVWGVTGLLLSFYEVV